MSSLAQEDWLALPLYSQEGVSLWVGLGRSEPLVRGAFRLTAVEPRFQAIIDAADRAPSRQDEAVGLLTSLPRDEWAALRTSLLPQNRETIEAIDSACALCPCNALRSS